MRTIILLAEAQVLMGIVPRPDLCADVMNTANYEGLNTTGAQIAVSLTINL